jgi:hypothetical protein
VILKAVVVVGFFDLEVDAEVSGRKHVKIEFVTASVVNDLQTLGLRTFAVRCEPKCDEGLRNACLSMRTRVELLRSLESAQAFAKDIPDVFSRPTLCIGQA